jgi:uroporphyrin-III C-methyltransferase/precorrin-2 dehydrogenase/sirohydrochlorin ferrochelatase
VIAVTGNLKHDEDISTLAKRKNIPVNMVSHAELSSFILPSIINRDPVQIAISTGGISPVLASMLRSLLESTIPQAHGKLAQFAAEYKKSGNKAFSIIP